jgi:hypothetical protein
MVVAFGMLRGSVRTDGKEGAHKQASWVSNMGSTFSKAFRILLKQDRVQDSECFLVQTL